MRILFALPYIPYPLDSGGNQAVFSMIDNLRKKHRISVIFRIYRHSEQVEALQRLWGDVDFYIFNYANVSAEKQPLIFKSFKFRFINYIKNSFNRKYDRYLYRMLYKSTSVESQLWTRLFLGLRSGNLDMDFCKFVKDVAVKHHFDVIQTEFIDFLDLCYYLPEKTKKVFVHHEISFVKNENELSLLPMVSDEMKIEYQKKKDAEISMLRRYDYIITLTDVDKKILSKYIPEKNIYVSPAVIAETRRLEFRDCGAEFVFLGGADHFPNMDGVDWLCREIIPELRKVLDGFRIYVVGKWNQYQQKMLGNIDPSIVFTGFIQDLNAFQNGKISIIPIRIGSGMRMKILDAVISGSPFITTTKGQEGMGFVDGVHCCIADTPVAFAEAMARMASDRAQQKALIMAAREKVSIEYNTDVMLKKRENFYTLISESH